MRGGGRTAPACYLSIDDRTLSPQPIPPCPPRRIGPTGAAVRTGPDGQPAAALLPPDRRRRAALGHDQRGGLVLASAPLPREPTLGANRLVRRGAAAGGRRPRPGQPPALPGVGRRVRGRRAPGQRALGLCGSGGERTRR